MVSLLQLVTVTASNIYQGGEPASMQPAPSSVLFLTRRDSSHPEGGGSELYVEKMAAALAERGSAVTLFCAAHPGAPAEEVRDGVRVLRRGGRLSGFLHALRL